MFVCPHVALFCGVPPCLLPKKSFQMCYGSLDPLLSSGVFVLFWFVSATSPADRRRVPREVTGIPSMVPRLAPVLLLQLCHVVFTWALLPSTLQLLKTCQGVTRGRLCSTKLRPAMVHFTLILALCDTRSYYCCVDYSLYIVV